MKKLHVFRFLLVLLSVFLIVVPYQSLVRAYTSSSDCPQDGCSIFLPIVHNGGKQLKIGLVTDTSGIDDQAFNQGAWQAVLDAEADLGATGAYLESTSQDDYATSINSFITQGYDLIITVGFLMSDATKAAAVAHPTQKFTIVDISYDPILPNVMSQIYSSEQSAFLCGYLAAGMTTNGKVATFGGMNIPQVTQFMDGYYQGVVYYNQENSTSVQVLGWDPFTQVGVFTNDFNNPTAGYVVAQGFLSEGADIIFPVAGTTGLGAAQAVQEQAGTWVIGVDTDWTITAPAYTSVVLTSAVKNVRATTYAVINLLYQNQFTYGNYVGTLANQGVGLGTISSSVPQVLLTKVEQVKADIIAGTIIVTP